MNQLQKNHFILSAEQYIKTFEYSGVDQVIESVTDSFLNKSSFSFVRIGDGEGRVLGYNYSQDKAEVDFILNVWFGETGLLMEEDDIFSLRDSLVSAIENASVLGLAKQFSQRKNALSVASAVYSVPPQKWMKIKKQEMLLVNAGMHKTLEKNNFISRLVDKGISNFYTISCHDLIDKLNRKHGDVFLKNIRIPGEKKYIKSEGRHYPDRYREVSGLLPEIVEAGQVWLVGGGVLGKVYCEIIRRHGGVAIDIGSIFDLWAEVGTRGYIRSYMNS